MKKIISLFMIITILICTVNIFDVFALSSGLTSFNNALNLLRESESTDNKEKFVEGWNMLLQNSGFMSDYITSTSVGGLVDVLADLYDTDLQNASTQDKIDALCDYILNGGLVEDSSGNFVGTELYNNLIKSTVDYVVNNSGMKYVYSFDLNRFTTSFGNGALYRGLKDLVSDNQDNNKIIFWWPTAYYGRIYRPCVIVYDFENCGFVPNSILNDKYVDCFGYDLISWVSLFNSNSISKDIYYWDDLQSQFINDNSLIDTMYFDNFFTVLDKQNSIIPSGFIDIQNNHASQRYVVSNNKVFTYCLYSDLNTLKSYSDGKAPYYYNNNVWQDFSNSTTGYTYTPTNINTVSYGDVISYVDSFNTENGYYPTFDNIENHIDDKNEDNINNGNDGGEGGGSGDGDGIGDIFGWLKGLGSAIASLIKGLGEFLTEIIAGLTEAITELLSGISDLIISVTQTIPTVFMDFLHACFDWMPDEWVGLFGACVLVMVLYGIIKLIRG